jgi:hypothetical protein
MLNEKYYVLMKISFATYNHPQNFVGSEHGLHLLFVAKIAEISCPF